MQFLVGRLHARCCANDRAWVRQWRKLLLRSCFPLTRWLTSLRAGRTDSQVQAWRRQSPTVAVAEKSVETPHVFLDKVVDMPVVCNNRCFLWLRSCSSSTVMNVPVIMRDSGCAPDSVHRGYGGNSSSQQRQVLDLPVAAMMGLFEAFCVIFRAPPVVPEVSASFSSSRR